MLITVTVIVGAAFAAIAVGFIVDLLVMVRRQGVELGVVREEQAAFKQEIMHHLLHLTVPSHTDRPVVGRSREARLAELRSRLGD